MVQCRTIRWCKIHDVNDFGLFHGYFLLILEKQGLNKHIPICTFQISTRGIIVLSIYQI